MYETVEIERQGDVATLWMNQPEVHNALNSQLIVGIAAACREIDADPNVRAVVLAGRGKSFSAGADLNWMKRAGEAGLNENLHDAMQLAGMLRNLAEMSKLTIARVQGAALGGGMGLASACDMCVASEKAVFATSEVRFGIIPAAISPYVLRAIGARQSYRYFQTAERISAVLALELGLAHEVATPEGLDSAVASLVTSLLQGEPNAQASAKKLIQAVAGQPINDALVEDTARNELLSFVPRRKLGKGCQPSLKNAPLYGSSSAKQGVYMHTQTISYQASNMPRAITEPKSATWSVDAIAELLDLPLPKLVFRAQQVHRQYFDPTEVQLSTLLSIKTGGCAENCGYCSQSAHHETTVEAQPMLDATVVKASAQAAKEAGASRFCMGAAWCQVRDRDLGTLTELVEVVRELGMESCLTAGMLKLHQAEALKKAGLDYYNHNLDTAPELYGQIVTTRTYQDRLDTLETVREAGLKTCSGGILGLGETRRQRVGLIAQLANLDPYPYPESVPINLLVTVEGTPLAGTEPLDPFEFVRVVAVARLTMPRARVRLSAGRQTLGDMGQALCFLAGTNSIFYGDTLLTRGNPAFADDRQLFERIGLRAQ